MGYTTDFFGAFSVTPTLTPEHRAYLVAFASTRRMKRDAAIAATLPDPVREAVGLPIGTDGGYYVGSAGNNHGQDHDESIIEYNEAPGMPVYHGGMDGFSNGGYQAFVEAQDAARKAGAQPGLWCQWVPNEDGTTIEWDEGEKFYEYVDWIRYLIVNFLEPWGYHLEGDVEWQGEEHDDRGVIRIHDNAISIGTYTGAVEFRPL